MYDTYVKTFSCVFPNKSKISLVDGIRKKELLSFRLSNNPVV